MTEYQINLGGYRHKLSVEPLSDKHLEVRFGYNKTLIEEIKAMDGAAWDPDLRRWTIKNTERNLYNLMMLEKGTDPVYDSPVTPLMVLRKQMYDHQRDMFSFAFQRKRCIIAGEMGVGKTLSMIELMGYGKNWWIVCPKSAKYVWLQEFRKWGYGEKDYQIMTYHRLSYAVANYENRPENIIFDESHNLKNPDSQRTRAALEISNEIPGYVVLLTGTPAPKDPTDWWAQVEICQPGFLRESTRNKLKFRLGRFETMQSLGGKNFKKLVHWIPEELNCLKQRLQGMVLPVFKKDCLDLPEKIYREIPLRCDPETTAFLKTLIQVEGRGVTALNKLRQYSDGFQYKSLCKQCMGDGYYGDKKEFFCRKCNGTGGTLSEFPTPKDEVLKEFLADEERNRLVIFAGFHASIDKIVKMGQDMGWKTIRLDGRGLQSEIAEPFDAFQNKKNADRICFVGHPKAGGISITLNCSDTIIYYSNDFDGASRPQSEDRIHRIGTEKAVIIDILWLPTDHYVLRNLKQKKSLQGVTTGEILEFLDQEKGNFYSDGKSLP